MIIATFSAVRFSPEMELLHNAFEVIFETHQWRGPLQADAFVDREEETRNGFFGKGILQDDKLAQNSGVPDIALVFLPDPEYPPDWMYDLFQELRVVAPNISVVWVLWNPSSFDVQGQLSRYNDPQTSSFLVNIFSPDSWPEANHFRDFNDVAHQGARFSEEDPFLAFIAWLAKFIG